MLRHDLFYPGAYSCPARFNIGYWSFAPQSDNVTLVSMQAIGSGNATGPQDMWARRAGGEKEFRGYWSGEAWAYPSANASFTSFQTGTYTVAAEDTWGQTVNLHLAVVAPATALACATASSNPTFAARSNDSSGPGPLKLEAYYAQLGSNNTYLLALSGKGSSPVTLTFFNFAVNAGLEFSPDHKQLQSCLYFTQNGTLAYPATFYPDQCSLIRAVLPPRHSAEIPFSLEFSDNVSQAFTPYP